jgi:hypothetical protein
VLQPFSSFYKATPSRPFQQPVRPGTWYVQAKQSGSSKLYYGVVVVDQSQSDEINRSRSPTSVWFDLVSDQTNGGGWSSLRNELQNVSMLWTEINPNNVNELLKAAKRGSTIQEIYNLNVQLSAR